MTDEEAHEFYKNPENLAISGPGYKRRKIDIVYNPPECGPQTFTYQSGQWIKVEPKE